MSVDIGACTIQASASSLGSWRNFSWGFSRTIEGAIRRRYRYIPRKDCFAATGWWRRARGERCGVAAPHRLRPQKNWRSFDCAPPACARRSSAQDDSIGGGATYPSVGVGRDLWDDGRFARTLARLRSGLRLRSESGDVRREWGGDGVICSWRAPWLFKRGGALRHGRLP